MYYYVCFQNCIDDYFSEDAPSLKFESFDTAIKYLANIDENSDVMAPDVKGKIRWYFASCGSDGELHNPDPEEDRIELYQIINIIPGYHDPMYIRDCYCDGEHAIISMRRDYILDFQGNIHQVSVGKIEYIQREEE